ncbi:MAG: hypothetical protein DRH12_14785 [Deltaproteobacteria bacterium]|nr:MAG: hypothetical protein DRH12_14785 [Deltaproteobacteria bacterium]
MTNQTGTIVWSANYKPFGEANITTNTIPNPFRFPGQYYDQETGLHYNYFRYYDPGVGRHLRGDPVASIELIFIKQISHRLEKHRFSMGLKSKKMTRLGVLGLYSYTRNNPETFFDRYGLTIDPLDLYDPTIPYRSPNIQSISSGISWAGMDYTLIWWSKESGWYPRIETGLSATLIGASLVKVTFQESDRCFSPEDTPEIAVGWSKHLGVFTSLDAKRYGFAVGFGIGLPVTPSVPISRKTATEILEPLVDIGF